MILMTRMFPIRLGGLGGGHTTVVDEEDYEQVNAFHWTVMRNRRTFYAHRKTWPERCEVRMHCFIFGVSTGIDHVNHDGLDNRRANLRLATQAQNSQNQRPQIGKTSVYKGVGWDASRGRWRAQICVNRKRVQLGCYTSEVEAALVYDQAARRWFGEFAYLNFPEE